MLTGSVELMRSLNRAAILNALRTGAPISRAGLADLTGLTRPTVSDIVAELIDQGWVREELAAVEETRRAGRRPISLQFNPKAGYAVGVDIGVTRIRTVLTDAAGAVLARASEPVGDPSGPGSVSPTAVIGSVVRTVRQVVTGIDPQRVAGVGVGMHGLVERAAGLSRFAPHFGWRSIPLGAALRERLPFPVTVDNDVRAMALGQSWFGAGQGAESLVCINVGAGIGSGIVIRGRLWHGSREGAGEVGHTTVVEDGPPCECGNTGCLEAVASGTAIAREAGLPDGRAVYEAALAGQAAARRILARAGRHLGTAVANLVNVLNPEVVTLGGAVMEAGDLIFGPLLETARKRALPSLTDGLRIVPVSFGAEAGAIGAATLVLEQLFLPLGEVGA
jgi:N-acetylglucosamine repressor